MSEINFINNILEIMYKSRSFVGENEQQDAKIGLHFIHVEVAPIPQAFSAMNDYIQCKDLVCCRLQYKIYNIKLRYKL